MRSTIRCTSKDTADPNIRTTAHAPLTSAEPQRNSTNDDPFGRGRESPPHRVKPQPAPWSAGEKCVFVVGGGGGPSNWHAHTHSSAINVSLSRSKTRRTTTRSAETENHRHTVLSHSPHRVPLASNRQGRVHRVPCPRSPAPLTLTSQTEPEERRLDRPRPRIGAHQVKPSTRGRGSWRAMGMEGSIECHAQHSPAPLTLTSQTEPDERRLDRPRPRIGAHQVKPSTHRQGSWRAMGMDGSMPTAHQRP